MVKDDQTYDDTIKQSLLYWQIANATGISINDRCLYLIKRGMTENDIDTMLSVLRKERELKKNNQQLAFEPIDFGYLLNGKSVYGTAGGQVSCNISGPRRFKVGSVRDHVLGFRGVNGKGEVIKSGGTVVKNVTGYDLSKLICGSYGTLMALTEITFKVLPAPDLGKTLIIHNAQLKKSLEYLNVSLSSSADVSGGVFYPEYFKDQFSLNDLTNKGPITAIRVEGVSSSIDKRVIALKKELGLLNNEVNFLENDQSKIFWKRYRG